MRRRPVRGAPSAGIARVAAFIWTALLVAAAAVPGDRVTLPSNSDLWAHGAGYAVHAFLTCLAVTRGRSRVRATAMAAIATIVLGAATEVLQAFVPARDPSLADWLADAVGAASGAAIGWTVVGQGGDR